MSKCLSSLLSILMRILLGLTERNEDEKVYFVCVRGFDVF